MTSKRTCIIALGMHRSGTSALTRVVNLLGAELPSKLIKNRYDNPTGHWESSEIVQLNDQMLHSKGLRWDSTPSLSPSSFDNNELAEYQARACNLIQMEFKDSDLFVIKDPRICILLPFWTRVLEMLDVRVVLLYIYRNPYEVAASLARRDGMALEEGVLLWFWYMEKALSGGEAFRRVMVSYGDLLENWQGEAEKIRLSLGIAWKADYRSAIMKVNAFLSNKHRHHQSEEITSKGLSHTIDAHLRQFVEKYEDQLKSVCWPEGMEVDVAKTRKIIEDEQDLTRKPGYRWAHIRRWMRTKVVTLSYKTLAMLSRFRR